MIVGNTQSKDCAQVSSSTSSSLFVELIFVKELSQCAGRLEELGSRDATAERLNR
jgi:hypothetical protein